MTNKVKTNILRGNTWDFSAGLLQAGCKCSISQFSLTGLNMAQSLHSTVFSVICIPQVRHCNLMYQCLKKECIFIKILILMPERCNLGVRDWFSCWSNFRNSQDYSRQADFFFLPLSEKGNKSYLSTSFSCLQLKAQGAPLARCSSC